MKVVKRDGSYQEFDSDKIRTAVTKAGLDEDLAGKVTRDVVEVMEASLNDENRSVERIQDIVELCLMKNGYIEEGRKYIHYRIERENARSERLDPDPTAIERYIHLSKYSRYREDLKRRENWKESTQRRFNMDAKRWPHLAEEIWEAAGWVENKIVLPSMRSMQFGGLAIEKNHCRLFNCSFSLADRPRFFSEMFYLLLSGCGCGFSVQRRHVSKLPELGEPDRSAVVFHVVEDSIEGWAKALDHLVAAYMSPDCNSYGLYPEFDYSEIRPLGAPIVTSGGKAPGHVPLKIMIEEVRSILDGAVGRKLRPIEVHDICCHIAMAVLAGGIRRSSLISLFSIDDHEMITAKTGDWFEHSPQRKMANNSAVIVRGDAHRHVDAFNKIFEFIREFGEPAFLFTAHPDYGVNPCAEISLNPVDPKTGETGWAFCNLTEINAAKIESKEHFLEAAKIAARIGSYQAAYTDFPYLTETSKKIADREALLGVSITGIVDNPDVMRPEWLRHACRAAIDENYRVAQQLGINTAARVTTVKPSGTASLVLGCVGSGIHPHHARRYIRRITANPLEPVFQFFREKNPHMCVEKPNGDWVIEFPVKSRDGAIVRDDLTAIAFLDMIFGVYENWVKPGTVDIMSSPGTTHNVSSTVNVKDDEWDEVRDHVWANRHRITAISFLPHTGDKVYPFSPREAIVNASDEARWNEIIRGYTPVDYSEMVEEEDTTDPRAVSACEGPKCEVSFE